MLVVGAPINRTDWLALRHRAADMNTLITLGTTAAFGYSLVVTVAPQPCFPSRYVRSTSKLWVSSSP
jgi:cation transport ATPase